MTNTTNPYANPVSSAPLLSPAEEKQWAVLTHVLSIFFGIISAAVFFFLFRNRGPFVRHHTTTEWNFQLTVLIISAVFFALCFVSFFVSFASGMAGSTSMPPGMALFFVGYFMIFITRIVAAVLGIRAAVLTNRGEFYSYPAFRFAR
ncbi:hypothetical protein HDC94_002179 [Leifsonia sp. AK011]|uniref:DUF4870 domain-containing protein n=1 Tax=Leifsonia sp. AK011 TaxID=2723075 RepID=UPI0015C7945B|nr:DUF4870 domain-containing protein [Leifsonia sp. AK011]NYF11023.1 hypothetical protein [Leifsonia sp. AK011]